jgi:hypothetical protein
MTEELHLEFLSVPAFACIVLYSYMFQAGNIDSKGWHIYELFCS